MFQRREVLFIKMSADNKVSLRDEEHIPSQSICCLACVAAVWGSLGQFGTACASHGCSVKLGGEMASAPRAGSQSRWTVGLGEAGSRTERGIFPTMLQGTRDLFKYL